MAIESVKKIFILGHRRLEDEVVGALQDLGVVEVTELLPADYAAPPGQEGEKERELELKIERVDHVLGQITRFAPHKGLGGGSGKVALSAEELGRTIADTDLEGIHARCRELEKELAKVHSRRARLEADRQHLAGWLPLEMPLDAVASGARSSMRLGQVPLQRWAAFQNACLAAGDDVHLQEVNTDAKFKYVLLINGRDLDPVVEGLLKEAEFSPFPLPPSPRTPRMMLREAEEECRRLSAREREIRSALGSLEPSRPALLALHDHLASQLVRERVRSGLARTSESFCLSGWVPASAAFGASRSLKGRFEALEVYVADPGEDDRVPVLLRNVRFAEPFEVVTDLYGRPVYRGVDPTPYLSVFFATFFGFCLTDAGYGVVLALLSAVLLWKAKPGTGPMTLKFYRLFFLGGLATIVLGAMVGGWFGVTVDWKLFDPLADLFIFFGLALGLGLLHLFTGLSIKMVRSIRAGDWLGGVCDQGLWMVLISALLSLGLGGIFRLGPGFMTGAKLASLLVALGIVFFQGRQADRAGARLGGLMGAAYQLLWLLLAADLSLWFLGLLAPASGWLALTAALAIAAVAGRGLGGALARVGMGLYALYGISGFLGDTLSYSRLVALGLTTGIVGMVINKMAGIAFTMPYLGWLLALFVLVFGHAFNLVINLLGAFVHSCRLQYVEFFTKFYESGGRAFKPFSLERKHTVIVD